MENQAKEKFLDLLRSTDVGNIKLAFQITKGIPDLAQYIKEFVDFKKLYLSRLEIRLYCKKRFSKNHKNSV